MINSYGDFTPLYWTSTDVHEGESSSVAPLSNFPSGTPDWRKVNVPAWNESDRMNLSMQTHPKDYVIQDLASDGMLKMMGYVIGQVSVLPVLSTEVPLRTTGLSRVNGSSLIIVKLTPHARSIYRKGAEESHWHISASAQIGDVLVRVCGGLQLLVLRKRRSQGWELVGYPTYGEEEPRGPHTGFGTLEEFLVF